MSHKLFGFSAEDVFNDVELFEHQRSSMDLFDMAPPVEGITTTYQTVLDEYGWPVKRLAGVKTRHIDLEVWRDLLDEYGYLDAKTPAEMSAIAEKIRPLAEERSYDARIAQFETERDRVVDHGEAWIGVGEHTRIRRPIRRQVGESVDIVGWTDGGMSQLDRIIFEDCYNGSRGVQRPSLNVPSTPNHLKLEWVTQRLRRIWPEADYHDAEVLITCWRSLSLSGSDVASLMDSFGDQTLDHTLASYVHLVGELDKVSDLTPLDETPAFIGWVDWLGTEYQAWFARQIEIDPDADEDWEFDPEPSHLPSSAEYKYQNIGYADPLDNWLARQPRSFRTAMSRLGWITCYAELMELAKDTATRFGPDAKRSDWQKVHGWVFWSRYRAIRRRMVDEIKRHPVVQKLIDRIQKAPAYKVRFVGWWLFDQQINGGKGSGPWPPAKHLKPGHWAYLKQCYCARAATLAPKAEEQDLSPAELEALAAM